MYTKGSYKNSSKPNYGLFDREVAGDNRGAALKEATKPKWWHRGYVDDLTDSQILLGVKQSPKGRSTLGSATRSEALKAGEAWAGEVTGFKSKDKMRAFRIGYKPKEGMQRANFQENYKYINEFGDITNKELKNVYIDILCKQEVNK